MKVNALTAAIVAVLINRWQAWRQEQYEARLRAAALGDAPAP